MIEHQLAFVCIAKTIHLGSHAWQTSTVVMSFALEVTISYKQRNGQYNAMGNLILATKSLAYLNVKKSISIAQKYFFQDIKIEKNYPLQTSDNRKIVFFFCRWVFRDAFITRLFISGFTMWLLITPLVTPLENNY